MSINFNRYLKQALWEYHKKKCFYCRENLQFKNVQIDHIISQNSFENKQQELRIHYSLPMDFDFNGLDNFAPSCQSCNSARKGSTQLENGIPIWLNEVKQGKNRVLANAKTLEQKLTLDLPCEHKEFFLSSTDFHLSELSLETLRKSNIPLYKGLAFNPDYYPLHLTSPESENDKVLVTNLIQYEKLRNQGYYGYTTPEIAVQSICEACLFFFKKLEEAIPMEKRFSFEQYFRSLPANVLHVHGPEEDFEYNHFDTIGKYVDSNDNAILESSPGEVKLTINHHDSNEQETYFFKEVLQANFSGEGNSEAIIFVHYQSAGSLNFSFALQATYTETQLIPIEQEDFTSSPS